MTVTPEAVAVTREALAAANLPLWRSGTQTGYVFTPVNGSTVLVTVEPPSGAQGPFGEVDDRRSEREWLLTEAADVLRAAGFGVALSLVHGTLLVGRDPLDVLGAALSEDQEAVERGRHEIEIKGDAA